MPIVGDDIKSQVGATITHRVLAKLFEDRGVELLRTYQLNFGGNMDFMNMLERKRLQSKKISKTQSVTSQIPHEMAKADVHIGPSDHVPWLDDRKFAYVRLEGRSFGDVPLNLEYKLEVWDSPNSAGVIIDAIRAAKIAKDRGIGGPILSAELLLHEVAARAVRRRRLPATWWRSSSAARSTASQRDAGPPARGLPGAARALPAGGPGPARSSNAGACRYGRRHVAGGTAAARQLHGRRSLASSPNCGACWPSGTSGGCSPPGWSRRPGTASSPPGSAPTCSSTRTTFPNPAPAAGAFAVLYLPYSLIGPVRRGVHRPLVAAPDPGLVGADPRGVRGADRGSLVASGNLGVPLYISVLLVLGVNRFFLSSLSAALPHVVAEDKLVMANSVSPTAGGIMAAIGGHRRPGRARGHRRRPSAAPRYPAGRRRAATSRPAWSPRPCRGTCSARCDEPGERQPGRRRWASSPRSRPGWPRAPATCCGAAARPRALGATGGQPASCTGSCS